MEGIIYRIADYKETSKILTILTPNGIETVIARGCKKMNSNLLFLCQTYNRISYVRSEKSMYSLIEGNIIDSNDSIKLDFKNVGLIYKAYKECLKIIKEFKPDIVIGVGGYVTFPVIMAAHKLKIKTFL